MLMNAFQAYEGGVQTAIGERTATDIAGLRLLHQNFA